ncbi:MAG: imidazole glycerol phosphate synthase subunit HisF [Tenacibaculum sp.]
MLKKRIIPCLDIKNGRAVKGVNFVNIKDAGNPIELAKQYAKQGADELVFLDITATLENRKTFLTLVRQIAKEINIPFTVGGGISTIDDAFALIKAGADKISINTAAVHKPQLISELKNQFGSQFIVLAIDTKKVNGKWKVFTKAATHQTELETLYWANKATALGAGEILLTSISSDGTKNGFDLDITQKISQALSIPVIASGGAGNPQHFKQLFTQTEASAGLAAGIFHYGEIVISTLKNQLKASNIPIR